MSQAKIGQNDTFKVVEVLQDGYTIENETTSVFLEKDQASKELRVGDSLDAFLYIDQSKTVVATMQKPLISAYEPAFVKVVEKIPGLGVFVDIGLKKDMLVSKDDLPHIKDQWPTVGDQLFCQLRSGKNQMVAKMVSRFRVSAHLEPQGELHVEDVVETHVFHVAEEGLVLFTPSGFEIFVYHKHTRRPYRLGEAATVEIIKQVNRLKYNGTLTKQKELSLDDDAEVILKALAKESCLPLGDKSHPDAIYKQLNMSKAAFKRALGRLYKQGKVVLSDHKTCLKED